MKPHLSFCHISCGDDLFQLIGALFCNHACQPTATDAELIHYQQAASVRKACAPYLAKVKQGHRFTQQLFIGSQGILGLWVKGIFFRFWEETSLPTLTQGHLIKESNP